MDRAVLDQALAGDETGDKVDDPPAIAFHKPPTCLP
jgi:hypothetical protein